MNPGESIGAYRLISRVSHGAMGEIWEAEAGAGAAVAVGTRVAIKLIPEFLAGDQALVDRLRREGEAVRRLDHPGIVRFIDIGQDDADSESAGRLFFVMELLRGETLAERLTRESPLPVVELERIAAELAEALAFIHSRKIVHRDLKPQNIFLIEGGCVKLIDLGVAKVLDEASLTVTGSHFGTPAYMSPESFRDSKSVLPSADVWSLGVILYECATGQLPFAGRTAASIIAKIADTNVTPQTPALLRPDVPPKLASLIERCLVRDAAKRLQDGAATYEALTGNVLVLPRERSKRVTPLRVAGAAAALVLAGAIWFVAFREGPSKAPENLSVATEEQYTPPPVYFSAPTMYDVGTTPTGIIAGDLNGDSILDLVVASWAGNDITVLLGRGDGTFDPLPRIALGNRIDTADILPVTLGIIDFDRDGKSDLLVKRFGNPTIVALRGRGDGTFDAPEPGPWRANWFFSVADLDGDGFGDIVADTDGAVALWLSGSEPRLIPVGENPVLATTGDFNGDGKVDILAIHSPDEKGIFRITVFLGAGDGQFTETRHGDVQPGGMADFVAVDLDGDGADELALTSDTTGRGRKLIFPLEKGVLASPWSVLDVGLSPEGLATSDWNGDGKTDLFVGDYEGNRAHLLLGRGDRTFAPAIPIEIGAGPIYSVAGDWNGDGRPDIATVTHATNQLAVLLNLGSEQDRTVTTESKSSDKFGGSGQLARFIEGEAPHTIALALTELARLDSEAVLAALNPSVQKSVRLALRDRGNVRPEVIDDLRTILGRKAEYVAAGSTPIKSPAPKKRAVRKGRVISDSISVEAYRQPHARFASSTGDWLGAALTLPVKVSVEKIEALHNDAAVALIPSPTVYGIAGVSQQRLDFIVQWDENLAQAAFDRLVGGPGKPLTKARELTDFERMQIERIYVHFLSDLREAWRPHHAMTPQLVAFESDPSRLFDYKESDPAVIVAHLKFTMGRVEGKMRLIYPRRFAE